MNTPPSFRPIHVYRWANLRAEFAARGWSQKDAVEHLGRSQAQVSQISSDRPIKVIGDQLASDLEGQLGLPEGALDHGLREGGVSGDKGTDFNLGVGSPSRALHDSVLEEAEKWVRFEEGIAGRYQPVRRLRRLLALLGLLVADGGALSPTHAAEILDAVRAQGAGNAREQPGTRAG